MLPWKQIRPKKKNGDFKKKLLIHFILKFEIYSVDYSFLAFHSSNVSPLPKYRCYGYMTIIFGDIVKNVPPPPKLIFLSFEIIDY